MPRLQPISDEILLSREYTFTADDQLETARVRLAIPKRMPDGRYECLAEISHEGSLWAWPMNGVDALQALLLALAMVELDLDRIAGGDQEAVRWLDGRERGLGLLRESASLISTRGDTGVG